VIAIENARLLGDLRERTDDLKESLEYQTATSDVLKVISRSTFDLNPILEYVIETAIRLCRAHMGSIFRLADGVYRWTVGYGLDPVYREIEERTPIAPGAGTLVGRVALEGRAVQIADALSDSDYAAKDDAQLTRARTMLGVPRCARACQSGSSPWRATGSRRSATRKSRWSPHSPIRR
jgi:two-component system, NtrC family, sensor kinase